MPADNRGTALVWRPPTNMPDQPNPAPDCARWQDVRTYADSLLADLRSAPDAVCAAIIEGAIVSLRAYQGTLKSTTRQGAHQ